MLPRWSQKAVCSGGCRIIIGKSRMTRIYRSHYCPGPLRSISRLPRIFSRLTRITITGDGTGMYTSYVYTCAHTRVHACRYTCIWAGRRIDAGPSCRSGSRIISFFVLRSVERCMGGSGKRSTAGRAGVGMVGVGNNHESWIGPGVGGWSIGKAAPIPNRRATAVPIGETVVATGRRDGFWNLFTFSKKGTVNGPAGTAAIGGTPSDLLGAVRSVWGTGGRYRSGSVSRGVANGFAGSPIMDGSKTAKPVMHAMVPGIATGGVYEGSLGRAGSP